MREIKCRGYYEYGDKWVYGSYVDNYIVNGVVEADEDYIAIEEWYPVDLESVSQFTGLKDKNGVEVYEGDVVLYKYASYKDISKVVYNTENASFIMIAIKEDDNKSMAKFKEGRKHNFVEGCVNGYDYVKVIGNIYENPELLEVK